MLLADDPELIRRGLQYCLALMDESLKVMDTANMDGVDGVKSLRDMEG